MLFITAKRNHSWQKYIMVNVSTLSYKSVNAFEQWHKHNDRDRKVQDTVQVHYTYQLLSHPQLWQQQQSSPRICSSCHQKVWKTAHTLAHSRHFQWHFTAPSQMISGVETLWIENALAYASIPYGSIDSCTYNHRMVYVFIVQISTVLLGKSMDTYLLHAVPKIIVQLLLIIVNGSFDSAT